MDSMAEDDPTLPVNFGDSINFSQLPNVTGGADITAANFSDHFPDTSAPAIQKVGGSGRMSPVRAHTMKEYEQQISDLKKENFSLKLRIYFMEERMQQKFEDNDDITTNIELKVEVESLKKELTEKQQLLVKASNAVESLAHEKDVIAEKLREEKDDALSQLKEELDGKCHRIQQELEDLQRANEGLQQQLNNASSTQNNLEGALQNKNMVSQKQHMDNKEILADKDKVIEQLNSALRAKDQIIGRLNDEKVLTARKTVQPLQEEVNKLKDQLREKEDQIDDIEKDANRDKDRDKERVRKQYEDVYLEQEKRVRDLEEATEQLQDEIRNKTKNIKDIENALKVSQKVIKELDGKVKDKDGEITSLESGGKKRDKAIQGLTEMVRAKDKEIQQLCDQIEDMEEALTRANESVNKAERKKYEGMEQQQSSLSELEEKLADMRSQLHTKDLENERLQRSMARRQQELDRLRDEARDAEDQTDGMVKQKEDAIKLLKDQLQDAKAKSKENTDAIEQHYQNLLDDGQHQLDLKEKTIQRLTKGLQEKDRLVKDYMELAKNASLPDAQQASTESILQDLRDRLADRDKALQEANEDRIKALDAKEGELRRLKQNLRDHQRDLDRANADTMEDANRLGELEAKMKDLENKNKQLSDSVKALNKANHDAEDNHHRSLGEKDAIISRLQAAIAGKEKELEKERDAQQKDQRRNGAAQNEAFQQLTERLRDKEKQLEEIVSERAQVAAANERATQDLLQTIRDKDGQIKDLNDKYNRALVDKSNALRDLQRQINEKEYELQNAEETLARADHEQGTLLGKMRNALAEKDKTIEKLLESGREKDRLFLEMQQSAVRASPSPSHHAEMARLKDDNDRLNREIDRLQDLIGRLRSQKPDEDYIATLKEDLDTKNKLLAKAKESLDSLQDEHEADRQAKQNAAKLRRKIMDLEDELQTKEDRIDALSNAAKIKDSLIKELKMENSRLINNDQSPRGSDSSEQLQQLMQEQIRELSRLTNALHSNLPLNVNITHQSETGSHREGPHDDRDRGSLQDVLGAELAAMQTLRRQIEDGMGRRNDNHLHVVIDRQGAVQSSTTSGVGSGIGSDSNDISPTITTASEAQRRSFGVGHDQESMQPPLFSQDSNLYVPPPQSTLSLDDLTYPTTATKEELQREVVDLRSQLQEAKRKQQAIEKRLEREELESLRSIPGHDLTDPTAATREELQREVADLSSKLKDARRRCQSLEKRLEREELESLRSVPGQERDGDPQMISGLQKDLAGLRNKLRESERQNIMLKQQLDAALLNQTSSDSSGDHVVPILKQQLDQAKGLLEEKNHKLQAAEQQNAALRHHLGIGPESPPESGRDLVDNLKQENEQLASQLQEAVERAQGTQYDGQTSIGASAEGVQVALLQKKLEKAQNLIELLKRHIRLNNSDGQEKEFNPELIVDMAKEIERLRKELDSMRERDSGTLDEADNMSRTRPVRGASSSKEAAMPPSLNKQLEKAQLEMNATKRRFKALTLKLHATEGTVHQQAERIKRYRRQLHNMGLPAPGTPKRVSSDSNLLNASTYAQANRRMSAVSLSQIPSSDDDRDSTSSASLSERSVGAADVTFSGFGLTNDTDELKEQVVVLKKQLKRCRHVIRKLQVRIQNGGFSRPTSPSRDPANPNPWFELVANRAAFERLQQDLENVTSQLEKVMDANASLQERNQELLSELVELQMQKQNSFSEEVIRSQELEIGRLHEQLAELRSLMGVLTNMLAEALGILKGLEKDNKTAMAGAYSESVSVIEERLRDGNEVVDTIKRLIGDETQFGRRRSEEDVKELFSDRLRVKDEQIQQLRDEIRGQQKLNRELQEILHNNQLKADGMKEELKRLKADQSRDSKVQEDLESQRKHNQDMQDILRRQEQRAEAARKDLEREYKKEIIILQDRLEEARKTNDKHREKKKKTSSPSSSQHLDGQGSIYLYETNIKLTTENSALSRRLAEQEDRTTRIKAELDRANKEIKRLLGEKRRLGDEKQRLHDQMTDNEQLANSLRFELSVYEQLHNKETSTRSHSSQERGGDHSRSPSSHSSHLHVIDRTTGVDLSELLQELRHLRIQLERSIDTNNALRIRLEEALREKSLSPKSEKASAASSPRATIISEEVRIHSSSSSSRRRSGEDRTKSNSARKLFTDGKTQRHSEENGHLDEDFTMDGIGPLFSQDGSRVKKSKHSDISEGGSKKESYAVSMATTYEAVRSGVKEAAVVGGTIEVLLREKLSRLAQVVEESSPHSQGDLAELESGDHTLLSTLSHDVKRLMKLLDTSRRHLVNFWMTDRLVQQHSQSDEVKELRKRLGAQERLMKEARDRLAATNREKECMEDAIIKQLCKTHNVIRKAKGNLQTAEA